MEAEFRLVGMLMILALGVWLVYKNSRTKSINVERPTLDMSVAVPNDKIVLVSNISKEQLQDTLADFCALYNREGIVVAPEIALSNDDRLAVVFPYDVAFDIFCYSINYLSYPPEVDGAEPIVIGWGTFATTETLQPELAGKKLMVFIPEEDEAQDHVSIVTEHNVAHAMNLSYLDKLQTFEEAEESYMPQPLNPGQTALWQRERITVPLQEVG